MVLLKGSAKLGVLPSNILLVLKKIENKSIAYSLAKFGSVGHQSIHCSAFESMWCEKLMIEAKINLNIKQEISLKKIFGGSQILMINATKIAGLDEIPIYPFACWNLNPGKLWSCFCLSFAWFCAHLTLFAEGYASESFFFFNFRHSPARVLEQCFKS